jgi:HK97 family phage portal protein
MKNTENDRVFNEVYTLLNVAPNDEMTAFTFKVNLIQEAISEGNGYAEIERNRRGEPIALHLLDSRKVERLRNYKSGEIVYKVIGGSFDGTDAYIPYRDMLHLPNLVTTQGQIGQGLVGYAQETLGISLSANQMAGNLFGNGGIPSGILTAEGTLSDEAFERIKASWDAATGGRKTGSTAILEEGLKYSPVSVPPDMLQFLESRKFGVLELARFLGLPPTKLFDGDSATYNNIEHSNLEVATDTLDTWARNLESEIDVKLLSKRRNGLRAEFDMYAVFRGDMTTRANYFQKMMQNAAITPNEIRRKEGLPPYESGDRFYVATNNFSPADRIDEVIDAQISSKTSNDSNEEEETEVEQELNAAAVEYLRKRTR